MYTPDRYQDTSRYTLEEWETLRRWGRTVEIVQRVVPGSTVLIGLLLFLAGLIFGVLA